MGRLTLNKFSVSIQESFNAVHDVLKSLITGLNNVNANTVTIISKIEDLKDTLITSRENNDRAHEDIN